MDEAGTKPQPAVSSQGEGAAVWQPLLEVGVGRHADGGLVCQAPVLSRSRLEQSAPAISPSRSQSISDRYCGLTTMVGVSPSG
jgi:hypothetical protein